MFSEKYYGAKKEVEEINKQINGVQSEIDKKEAGKKQLLQKIEELKYAQKQDKSALDRNVLDYMRNKIRIERIDGRITPIEEDSAIDEYNDEYEKSVEAKQQKIKTINESIAVMNGEIAKLKSKIVELKETRKKPEAIIKREDDNYAEEIRLRAELSYLKAEYDRYYSYDDLEDSYSSFGSSYYSQNSAAQEAEKIRRTIEREAEETRRQMARDAEKSRKAAAKAANEAKWADYRRQRDIEMKEFHEKQARDRMIDTRCRSCKVVSCGMRYNRSNVNCANYRPK